MWAVSFYIASIQWSNETKKAKTIYSKNERKKENRKKQIVWQERQKVNYFSNDEIVF